MTLRVFLKSGIIRRNFQVVIPNKSIGPVSGLDDTTPETGAMEMCIWRCNF